MKKTNTRIQKYCFAFIPYSHKSIWRKDILSSIFPFISEEVAQEIIQPHLLDSLLEYRHSIHASILNEYTFYDVRAVFDHCFVFSVNMKFGNWKSEVNGAYVLIPYNKFKNIKTTLSRARKLIMYGNMRRKV